MIDTKVTVTTNVNETPDKRAIALRTGYWVGLAHAALPQEVQHYFLNFEVGVFSHKEGFVTVNVKLVTLFPHGKDELIRDQFQRHEKDYHIEPPMDMFRTDAQISSSTVWLKREFLNALVTHIQKLSSELKRGSESVNRQLLLALGAKETNP
jgi:hypothetical protein